MKIGLAQIDSEVGNLDKNCKKFGEYASRAKSENCEVVIFPEMSDTGYDDGDGYDDQYDDQDYQNSEYDEGHESEDAYDDYDEGYDYESTHRRAA